ncbi:MAG: hypothetical protein ACTTGJ_02950 [Clostridium sp.]
MERIEETKEVKEIKKMKMDISNVKFRNVEIPLCGIKMFNSFEEIVGLLKNIEEKVFDKYIDNIFNLKEDKTKDKNSIYVINILISMYIYSRIYLKIDEYYHICLEVCKTYLNNIGRTNNIPNKKDIELRKKVDKNNTDLIYNLQLIYKLNRKVAINIGKLRMNILEKIHIFNIEEKVVFDASNIKSEDIILKIKKEFNQNLDKYIEIESFNIFLKKHIKSFNNSKIDKKDKENLNVSKKIKLPLELILKHNKEFREIENEIYLQVSKKILKEVDRLKNEEKEKLSKMQEKHLGVEHTRYLKLKYYNEILDEYFSKYLVSLLKVYYDSYIYEKYNNYKFYLKEMRLLETYPYLKDIINKNKGYFEEKENICDKKVYDRYSIFKAEKTMEEFKENVPIINGKKWLPVFLNKDYNISIMNDKNKNININKDKEINKNEEKENLKNNNKLYKMYNLTKQEKEEILKALKIFGKEYVKITKEYLNEDNIYYVKDAQIRKFNYAFINNIIFTTLDFETIFHELGHAIQYTYSFIERKDKINELCNDTTLSEMYSQMLEYVYFKYLINNEKENNNNNDNNKSINLIRTKKAYMLYKLMLLSELPIYMQINNKIFEYIVSIENNKIDKDKYELIEENISELISKLTLKEKYEMFVNPKYYKKMFSHYKYIFTMYLVPHIYKKIKNNKDKYMHKYIESMKKFLYNSFEKTLELLEIDLEKDRKMIMKDYIEAIEKTSSFLDEI